MDLKLTNKTAIVTAASRGLGKAIATELAREGANVFLSSRNQEALHEAIEEIKAETNNQQVSYVTCDITDSADIENLVNKALVRTGKIDVLINNSGGPPAGGFLTMTDEDWQSAFELNMLSYVRLMRAVIPHMQKNGFGRIVSNTSSSIKQTIDQLVLSNTMRPGVLGLMKSLSQEFGADNILMNTVGPGTIATDRIEELNEIRAETKGVTPSQIRQVAEKQIPLKRYGKPDEFARAVAFLASGANTYITGQSLLIDGGSIKAL